MFYIAVITISAAMALVFFILALYMMRRQRRSRRYEARLESAFARAKDRRVHGTVRIGSVYG